MAYDSTIRIGFDEYQIGEYAKTKKNWGYRIKPIGGFFCNNK
jgi:hypothetical protein